MKTPHQFMSSAEDTGLNNNQPQNNMNIQQNTPCVRLKKAEFCLRKTSLRGDHNIRLRGIKQCPAHSDEDVSHVVLKT